MTEKQLEKILCNFWDATHKAPIPPPRDFELIGKILRDNSNLLEPLVSPDACGKWQKEKPNKHCYFVHRYNGKDTKPSLFEAYLDTGILCVANIQDDEFVETMENFADGEFFIIEI